MASQGRSIEAVVTLDLKPFQSKISEVKTLLNELSNGINIDFGAGKLSHQMDDLKKILRGVGEEAEKITTAFNKIEGMSRLLESLSQVKSKLEYIQNDIDKINASVIKVDESTNKISATENKLNNIMNDGLKTLQSTNGQLSRASKEANGLLTVHKGVTDYFLNEDKILRMSLRTIQEQDKILADKLAKSERETQLAKEIADINKMDMDLRKATGTALSEIVDLTGLEADNILKVANGEKEVLSFIEKQVSAEKERLDLIMAINEMESAQISKVPVTGGNGTKGGKNKLDKMGYLPSRIGSMALTMWGFNEIMDIYDKAMQNMNAYGSQKTYADLMRTDSRYLTQTKQDVNDINTGVKELNKSLNETYKGGKSLQQMYQKVDMQSVGANAMDTAFKYGVQAENLDELAEVMAIYGSEFVRQGRSQEDSILAVNDALDGEIRRLKEVGIDREDLEAHGWKEGDTMSMITALREIAEERGYDVVAQKVTNLSDAITVLEIRIAQDLVGAFKVLEPILTEVAKDFIYMLDTFEWAWSGVRDIWNDFTTELDKTFGVQNVQKYGGGLLKLVGWVITLGITFGVVYKIVSSLKGMLSGLFGVLGKGTDDIAKTTGDVAKTGGTVGKDSGGGFRENFMKQWSKTGKDIGKMARVFADVVVGMAMAFVVIEEAILIISGIGATYDALKPQFESGIEFIKEFGLWFALLGGAMLVLSYALDKVPDSAMSSIGKGAVKLATGMAITMGLIAEAIALLNVPLLAIASIGLVQEFAEEQINDGLAVIRMFGDALHYIANDDTIGWFIIGFVALSGILGVTADVVALPMALGIATTLGLIAEAIGLLILPLGAIALLGYSVTALNQENINRGAEAIRLVGECLKSLEPAIRNLLLVDLEVFGVNLVEWGNKLVTGKTGLQSLTQDILPNLIQFVTDFNNLQIGESVDTTKVESITQMANDIPPLFNAMTNLNNAMGTNNALGNIGGAIGGFISGSVGMGLKGKLDQLYRDVKDVMDFATKLGGLGSTNGANASAIGQTANAIAQLKAKMDTMVTTINTASVNVRTASKSLGSAIKVGFNEGSSGFNTAVISVLAKGISEVQHRYDTWHSGGVASAQKLADGFDKLGGKLKASIREEMGYALAEIDNYKDDFYNKGAMLGDALVQGFKSRKALDQNSPAKITKSIYEEMQYSMEALDIGRQMMYNGGVRLGQALTNGYNSTGNLRTNVDVLAQKGVNSEQLQANAKNVQVNTKGNQQVPQSFNPTFNIDMSNSTIIGIQDLNQRIEEGIDKAMIKYHSPNGAIGY